jgi:hypothetical protein
MVGAGEGACGCEGRKGSCTMDLLIRLIPRQYPGSTRPPCLNPPQSLVTASMSLGRNAAV